MKDGKRTALLYLAPLDGDITSRNFLYQDSAMQGTMTHLSYNHLWQAYSCLHRDMGNNTLL